MEKPEDEESITTKKITDWSVENVAYFISHIDENNYFAQYADSFREQCIDGKSLLPLSVDILIKHMQFKVGPAIRLNEHLEKLRKSYQAANPGTNTASTSAENLMSIKPKTVRLMKELVACTSQKSKITDWSVEDVVNYIETVGKKYYASFSHKFRLQSIDGEALLSLNTENLVDHFQMKLGPAIQLNDHLEQLRCSVLSNLLINQQKLHESEFDLI